MPKLTRLTSQYVRRELLGLFRRKYLPLLVRHICRQPTDGSTWPALAVPFDVESMRAMIETLESLPRARVERKPASPLREYRRELTIAKRRRTNARARVAKYARLVRYHSKPRKRRGGGGVTQRTQIGGVPGWILCRGSVRTTRSDCSTCS
jgi:hypothetical protein